MAGKLRTRFFEHLKAGFFILLRPLQSSGNGVRTDFSGVCSIRVSPHYYSLRAFPKTACRPSKT